MKSSIKYFLTTLFMLTSACAENETPTTDKMKDKEKSKSKSEYVTPKRDRAYLRAKSEYVEGRPNVLIIGDSISIGYTASH